MRPGSTAGSVLSEERHPYKGLLVLGWGQMQELSLSAGEG